MELYPLNGLRCSAEPWAIHAGGTYLKPGMRCSVGAMSARPPRGWPHLATAAACVVDNFATDFGDLHVTLTMEGAKVQHPKAPIFLTPGEIHRLAGAQRLGSRTRSVEVGDQGRAVHIIKGLPDGGHLVRAHVTGGPNFDRVFDVG